LRKDTERKEKIMMMMFRHRQQMVILILLILVNTLVDAQIAEQDDVNRVSIRGEGDRNLTDTDSNKETNETTTDEETITTEAPGDEQLVPRTQVPPIQSAWIYYFDDDTGVNDTKPENGAIEDGEIQGTKEYIIVYKQPDDFGIAEEILAATDVAVQSTVIENGGSIKYEYDAALNGVSASLTNAGLEELMKQDGIDFIEEVVPMNKATTWGQDRVDEKDLTPNTLDYVWKRNRSAGAGVNVCVRCVFDVSENNLIAKIVCCTQSLLYTCGITGY
jgi:hypothetical protein